jgi:hypothetical protein
MPFRKDQLDRWNLPAAMAAAASTLHEVDTWQFPGEKAGPPRPPGV